MKTALATEPEWYGYLVDECREIISGANHTSRRALLEGYHRLGKRIVTDPNFRKATKGNLGSFQGLGKKIGCSVQTVYYAVQFFEKYPDLSKLPPDMDSWRKVTQGLPDSGGMGGEKPWLRYYQVWNFQEADKRFGVTHPGQIPAQVIMNLNYYYTKPGDLVVDLFGGGGSTLDVCLAKDPDFGGRECRIFDIDPAREDITRWDVVKSGLPKFPHARLLFLDPPYWKQKKGDYGPDKTNMANLTLGEFHDELEKVITAGFHRSDIVALIIGPTQENWELIDHAAEMIVRIGVPWKRIQVPYSTQQHGGNYVLNAQKEKQWLYLARDLMLWWP